MTLSKLKPALILLQESKINENNVGIFEGWARGMDYEIETVPAQGSVGGLISLWKKGYLIVISISKNQTFVIMIVKFPCHNENCLLINVYGPNSENERGVFFADLGLHLNNHQGPIAIGGDFPYTWKREKGRETTVMAINSLNSSLSNICLSTY